jgi:protein involved in polysaccharide export with SLBB domain
MGNTPPSESGDETPPIPVPETEYEYLVSPKDVLQIAIVNEGELGTTFEVNEKDGTINYPFIEYVKVAGLTVKQIEKLITEKLKEGEWFVEPQVNVMVLKYSEKFFYVQGQVNKPGQYSFTGENEMTVHRAIIKAGGFTRIASKKVILLTSDEQGNKKRLEVDVGDIIKNRIPDPLVKADDIIYVRESFL